uniref:Uncharacterized protein n=1 Tax=Arundo donax TaxID=35708 RepID=A0A0A9ARG9_ARUDO
MFCRFPKVFGIEPEI